MSLLGGLKSAYNGWVKRNILLPLGKIEKVDKRTEHIEKKQDEMAERQETLTDAVVALGESHEDENDFDVSKFRKETGRTDGSDDFLADDD